MGRADYYKKNDYNAICDRCGFKFKASDLSADSYTSRATGSVVLFVCAGCNDPIHPQELVTGVEDRQYVPIPRPDRISGVTTLNTDTFVTTTGVDGIVHTKPTINTDDGAGDDVLSGNSTTINNNPD